MASTDGDTDGSASELTDVFWERHANPLSGATRMAVVPLVFYALYHRRWRLLVATAVFAAVNPVLFPPPDRTDHWLSRGVYGERAWMADGKPVFGTTYPAVLNTLNLPAFAVAVVSALRRRPLATALAALASFVLKLAYVDEMAAYYERRRLEEATAGSRPDGRGG